MDDRIAHLEETLHREIPLCAAMGVRVLSASRPALILEAPLAPNLNHKSTAFGGSLNALAMLAGWAVCHLEIRPLSPAAQVVIQECAVSFLRPVAADFRAVCGYPDPGMVSRLALSLERKGKARLSLDSRIYPAAAADISGTASGEPHAIFSGVYVVISGATPA